MPDVLRYADVSAPPPQPPTDRGRPANSHSTRAKPNQSRGNRFKQISGSAAQASFVSGPAPTQQHCVFVGGTTTNGESTCCGARGDVRNTPVSQVPEGWAEVSQPPPPPPRLGPGGGIGIRGFGHVLWACPPRPRPVRCVCQSIAASHRRTRGGAPPGPLVRPTAEGHDRGWASGVLCTKGKGVRQITNAPNIASGAVQSEDHWTSVRCRHSGCEGGALGSSEAGQASMSQSGTSTITPFYGRPRETFSLVHIFGGCH